MNEMKIFENEELGKVRTVFIEGFPWWVLKDVCDILGIVNSRDVVKRLDDDEVSRFNLRSLSGETNIINESGLYNVILRSDKPKAKKFKKWVTGEILPSIRKHGLYATNEILGDPEFLLKSLQALMKEREKNKELKPKAAYYDLFFNSDELIPVSFIAKLYGISSKKINYLLEEKNIQHRRGKRWGLNNECNNKGYTRHDVNNHMYWTREGRLFLYERLKEDGILPVLEGVTAC